MQSYLQTTNDCYEIMRATMYVHTNALPDVPRGKDGADSVYEYGYGIEECLTQQTQPPSAFCFPTVSWLTHMKAHERGSHRTLCSSCVTAPAMSPTKTGSTASFSIEVQRHTRKKRGNVVKPRPAHVHLTLRIEKILPYERPWRQIGSK